MKAFAMNRLTMLAAILAFFFPVAARAVDCARSTSLAEKIICANPQLLQLDAVLNADYAAKQDRGVVSRSQEDWLTEKDACVDAACLEAAYKKRIQELSGAEKIFVFRQAAPEWDVIVSASGCDNPDFPSCRGLATVDVFTKDNGVLSQRIEMPEFFVQLDDKGETIINKAEGYGEYNSCLVVGDFNFDGYSDLALRSGNKGAYSGQIAALFVRYARTGDAGGYGAPSYDIYLYDPDQKRFIRNEALTDLASHNMGLFIVDPEAKTLQTFRKTDPAWYISEKYQLKGNTLFQVEGRGQMWRPGDMPPVKQRSAPVAWFMNKMHYVGKYSTVLFFCFWVIAVLLFIAAYGHMNELKEYMSVAHKEKWKKMKGIIGEWGMERSLFLWSSENFGDPNIDRIRKKIKRFYLYFFLCVCLGLASGWLGIF